MARQQPIVHEKGDKEYRVTIKVEELTLEDPTTGRANIQAIATSVRSYIADDILMGVMLQHAVIESQVLHWRGK